jgi:hypothetical protein
VIDPLTVGEVAQVLTELGEAYRGDWSWFDGRTLRSQLETFEGWLLDSSTWPGVKAAREQFSLCPHGEGMWGMYCDDYRHGEDEPR